MTLRTKTLIIIGLTLIGLVVLLWILSRPIMLDGFAAVDAERTERDVRRIRAVLACDIDALSTLASDYAGWDDTYEFIETGSEAYTDSNLVDSTFIDTKINLMLFVNSDGRIVFAKTFDLLQQQSVQTPDVMLETA